MQKLNDKLYRELGGGIIATLTLFLAVLIWVIFPSRTSNVTMNILGFTIAIVLIVALYRWHQKVNVESRALYQFHAGKKVGAIDKIILVIFAYGVDRYISPAFKFGDESKNQEKIIEAMRNQNFWESLYETGIQAPIIEEILFRGLGYSFLVLILLYFMRANTENQSRRIIATFIFFVISSFVFGYLHVSPYGDYENMGSYILSGMIFSVVFLLTKNIVYSIMVHMLNNIVVTLNTYYYKLHVMSYPMGDYANHILIIILLLLLIERTSRGINYAMQYAETNQQLSDKELLRRFWQKLKQRYFHFES